MPEKPAGCLSHARIRAAVRRCRVRKIKRTYLLQLACGRRLPETVGEVVEPCLIFILEVKQCAYRILPALRSGAAVLQWSVMHLRLRLLSLVALPITPLSLCVGQSHGH